MATFYFLASAHKQTHYSLDNMIIKFYYLSNNTL